MSAHDTPVLPLKLDNVWYHGRGDIPLIKEFNLELDAGTRTMIVGPNGAGKSLLLRLCHGLLQPNQGSVTWASPETAKYAQAMVFQRPVMLRRSGRANIEHALALHNVPQRERADIVHDVLKRTGMTRQADAPARVLSFGEQQRLAIARAWALKPQILFLDEPTASLDPSASHQIEELIQAIFAQGTKIVMTTHDLGQARRLGDEVLFLHRGRLLEQAPAEQFFDRPDNDLAQAFVKGELLWWKRGEGPRHDPKHAR
ncbi:ATP-binding cassette domain-containing protein [Magnetovibrio sp. PR-2]|uniref:ATP-binding cassette domain-containing protein n=1 Tax=Magnetovibrio sp. PR-2 TaxID=3120356 RepID=UPI002FCE3FFC